MNSGCVKECAKSKNVVIWYFGHYDKRAVCVGRKPTDHLSE